MIAIRSIVYRPIEAKPGEQRPEKGYIRHQLTEANLIEGYGIEGDSKGGNPKRNLNVMDELTQQELAKEGYPIGPGMLGENIILSGGDLRNFEPGTHLKFGDEAVIELLKFRVGCEQLTKLDGRMPDAVQGRVGFMCRVVKSGKIKVGDPVEVVTEPVQS